MVLVLVRSRRRIGGHSRTENLRLVMVGEVVELIVLYLSRDRVDGHPGANSHTNRFLC